MTKKKPEDSEEQVKKAQDLPEGVATVAQDLGIDPALITQFLPVVRAILNNEIDQRIEIAVEPLASGLNKVINHLNGHEQAGAPDSPHIAAPTPPVLPATPQAPTAVSQELLLTIAKAMLAPDKPANPMGPANIDSMISLFQTMQHMGQLYMAPYIDGSDSALRMVNAATRAGLAPGDVAATGLSENENWRKNAAHNSPTPG